MPLANSSRSVISKLRAYFDWAKVDEKLIGLFPWHVNWLPPAAATGGACDMRLGATDIPGVVDELIKIAEWIKANNHVLPRPSPPRSKTDDRTVPTINSDDVIWQVEPPTTKLALNTTLTGSPGSESMV